MIELLAGNDTFSKEINFELAYLRDYSHHLLKEQREKFKLPKTKNRYFFFQTKFIIATHMKVICKIQLKSLQSPLVYRAKSII